ncbi:GtrA family protein [Weissella muntiaci]|uniref:GtrA family protein n=1 Tax=Weissella muntiaci TaxID=2508881 RepID=UPI001FE92455|nr:GtrA family protein [Weissella muntiaci]
MINKIFNGISVLLDSEKFRFLLVGGFNTAFGFAIYALFTWLLRGLEFGYMLALIISQVASLFVAFDLHKKFTFKTQGHVVKDFIRFTMVNAVNYAFNLLLLPILVHGFKFNALVAQLSILIFTTVVSFIGHKYFSFRR